MKTLTFKDLYEEEKKKPTAAQAFVSEIARLTERSEMTVRMWLSGAQTPDRLTQRVIAEHFGTEREALFPEADTEDGNETERA